ncbi:dystrophin [Echinococcus multilocularis]|uniref:Dystrophin n=1 Tax=Echinococcus multilocularis TaxID=6211 RepID=A0A0S4MIN2_ECHMU|nr:dystrophin [Echinococcus multilocularis]
MEKMWEGQREVYLSTAHGRGGSRGRQRGEEDELCDFAIVELDRDGDKTGVITVRRSRVDKCVLTVGRRESEGKNDLGYWEGKLLVENVIFAIISTPLFEARYLNKPRASTCLPLNKSNYPDPTSMAPSPLQLIHKLMQERSWATKAIFGFVPCTNPW